MNLIDKIKAFFVIKKAIENIKEENKKMETQIKPGWKTTEFWATMATNVIAVVGALSKFISPDVSAIVIAIANAIYSISRGMAKKPAEDIPAK
jgi:hypothetical protein